MPKLKCLLITILFVITSMPSYAVDDAGADKYISDQRAACAKNTAMEWNDSLNRCVGKKEARETRNAAKDCNAIEDLKAREQCHIKLAEKNTGLSSDPNSLETGNVGKSAIMNGVGTAYAVLGMINGVGSSKKESACTSKKIYGYTAMAGLATDIWLKIRAKKKMDGLAGKYKLEKTQNPYDAQIKALQYLKEEQETVADIAGMEKKRNMLLMLGYGAATAMAIYEWAAPTLNSQCYAKEPEKKEPAACKEGDTCVNVAADKCAQNPNTPDCFMGPPAPPEEMGPPAPPEQMGPPAPPPEQMGPPAPGEKPTPLAVEPTKPGATVPDTAEIAKPAAAASGVELTRKTNGGVTQVEIPGDVNNGGKTSAIVGSNVIDKSSGRVIGTIDTKSTNPTVTYFNNPGQDGPKIVKVDGIKNVGTGAIVSMDGTQSLRTQGLDFSSSADTSANRVKFNSSGTSAPRSTTTGGTLNINDAKIKGKK